MPIEKTKYINKVICGSETLIDLTSDTAVASDVAQGKTFHLADGSIGIGTATEGGGSSTAERKQINFVDYDGTILHSYTSTEWESVTTLPANPSHTGLIAQGWNWTKAQIDEQLSAIPDGDILVGQMYVTASGDTEIDISIDNEGLPLYLIFAISGYATVDWGDNSATTTVEGSTTASSKYILHEYASTGKYTISIHVSGQLSFRGSNNYPAVLSVASSGTKLRSRIYCNAISAIRLGNSVSIGTYAFNYCYSLQSIAIPSSVTSIGSYVFNYCYSLQSITIPKNVTAIGTYTSNYCYSLQSIAIPSSVTSIGSYVFNYCYSLQSITIPKNVTAINGNAFSECHSLQSLIIPDGIAKINDYTFNNCVSLPSVTIPEGVTSIGNYAFRSCYKLQAIILPEGVTSIGSYTFGYCHSLQSITIPNTVTKISNNAFDQCYSLQSITIPSSVTSIGNNAFQNCYGLKEYHLSATTPPTLGTGVFTGIGDAIIYVPQGCLEAYQTATNWSTYKAFMQEES